MLLLGVTMFLLVQDAAGLAAAALIGQPPAIGLIAGSVSMLGGHGTAIAWAPVFTEQAGIGNALEIGVLCATAGLVLASVAGGPLAHVLVGEEIGHRVDRRDRGLGVVERAQHLG